MEKPLITHRELVDLVKFDRATGHFYWRRGARGRKGVYEPLGTKDLDGNIIIKLNGKRYLAHRLAWFYEFASFPYFKLQHVNGDKKDNRIKNLRIMKDHPMPDEDEEVTPQKHKSAYKGVSWNAARGKWIAKVSSHGDSVYLGGFDSEEEAVEAVRSAKGARTAEGQGKRPSRGVSWQEHAKKWRARKMIRGTLHEVGYFDTQEEAERAMARFVSGQRSR